MSKANKALRHSQAGFTLLEVMVSLAILASIASFAMQIFYRGVDRAIDIEQMSYATILAESKMDEVLMAEDITAAASSGVFSDEAFRYRVLVEPVPYDGEVPDYDLYRIEVAVLWGEEAFERELDLTSLRLVANEEKVINRGSGGASTSEQAEGGISF